MRLLLRLDFTLVESFGIFLLWNPRRGKIRNSSGYGVICINNGGIRQLGQTSWLSKYNKVWLKSLVMKAVALKTLVEKGPHKTRDNLPAWRKTMKRVKLKSSKHSSNILCQRQMTAIYLEVNFTKLILKVNRGNCSSYKNINLYFYYTLH